MWSFLKGEMNILMAHDQEWEQELSPYNQYEEERTHNLESVFEEFMAYHASSKDNQNSIKNHEIHFSKSYLIENFHGGPKLQPYHQNEAERVSNLDKLSMQFMETAKSTQQALQISHFLLKVELLLGWTTRVL